VDGVRVLPHYLGAPTAVVEVLLGERGQRTTRPIRHFESWREPDQAAVATQPVVHLPVLRARERVVVTADRLEGLAPENPEIDGVDRAFVTTDVERRIADAEATSHRSRNRAFERGAS